MNLFRKIVRVGYQGAPGSNSERAAKVFVENKGWENCELIPCIDSEGVINSLVDGKVNYGVVARKNVIAGEVVETRIALSQVDYTINDSIDLAIHHCFCTLPETPLNEVLRIYSHPQALSQTCDFLNKNFLTLERIEYRDTALAAQDLRAGKLNGASAVITTREAAIESHLTIHFDNISNIKNNHTNFILISDCRKNVKPKS